MTVHHPLPSQSLHDAFTAYFGDAIGAPPPPSQRAGLTAHAPRQAAAFDAMPVYHLGLRSIGNIAVFDQLAPSAWIGWPTAGETPYQAIELAADDSRLVALHEHNDLQPLAGLAASLTDLTADHEFSAALLIVDALFVRAIWLRARDRDADLVIPTGTVVPPLATDRHYDLQEFSNVIAEMAKASSARTPSTIGHDGKN
jgi:hypothetical protein